MIRRTLERALAATGQNQPAPPDPRSAAEREHDRWHAVEPRKPAEYDLDLRGVTLAEGVNQVELITGARNWAAALQAPPDLARALFRDILATKGSPNAGEVAETLAGIRMDYTAAVRDATYALERAGNTSPGRAVKATDLSPFALSQLAIFGAHLRRYATSRPKS
jgi:hypothetical protein